KQPRQVDVDELIPVQGEDVAGLAAGAGRKADPAATAERLRLADRDDLGPDPTQRRLEQLLLAGRAADEHADDACGHELLDLVGGQRPAAHLDERFRPALCRVAKPLGLAAGEDDCFHYASWRSG